VSGKATQFEVNVGDGDFEALVEQLRSLLITARRGHDEAVSQLEDESRQIEQERSQFDQERIELRKEITRLEQLSSQQARDLTLLAQVNDEKAELEQQCKALRQELEDLQASHRESVSQKEKAGAEPYRARPTSTGTSAAGTRAEATPAGAGPQRPRSASSPQSGSPGAAAGTANTGKDSRRIATPCLVVVRHPVFNEEGQGWALERSTESLSLLVDEAYPVGTTLKVRSGKSVHRTWLDIVVTECQAERVSFRLQCSFVNPVAWADVQHLAD
jgi:hypothetical protein